MKELPTYTPDFEEYIRMKEAGSDGFPYEREYTPASRSTKIRILNYLKGRPWADNKQLSFVLNVSISTIRYHLRKLQTEGVIVRFNSEGYKGHFWEIIK